MSQKVSACITSFNEEANIERCLRSVRWCDEIIVLDSFSTDRTVELSRRYTDRVYQHEWLGYIGQKNLIRNLASHPWLLYIDADEEVSEGLRQEIQKELATTSTKFVGYSFPRQVFYLGKWIRHGEWYPDIKLRLFRKAYGHSAGQEPHDLVIVDGPVKTLRSPLFHYTYDDINEHLESMVRFSSIAARAKYDEGRRCRLSDISLRPLWRFFKAYILNHGCMDGRRGLFIAMASSFGVAVKYMKLWEIEYEETAFTKSSHADSPEKD